MGIILVHAALAAQEKDAEEARDDVQQAQAYASLFVRYWEVA